MGQIPNKLNVCVALSGGVDSAVAAALLKKQGYNVTGMFMKNWAGEDFGVKSDCPWEQDQKDAEAVCKILNIPFRSVNFEKEYRQSVIKYFFEEYSKGRTPNPDVICNKEIKFKVFIKKAEMLGAQLIATGHYARVKTSGELLELHKGVDRNKDQSYFLHGLNQYQLSRTIFPLGDLTKPEVRVLATKFKLPNAKKKDSQGICFIGKINVSEFLRENIQIRPGKIIDIDSGKTLGKHDGVMFYTIGQRHGMGIGGSGKPYFVVKKDFIKNILFVGLGEDHPLLYWKDIYYSQSHFISGKIPIDLQMEASIRYRHFPECGKLIPDKNLFRFLSPQKAPSAGQSIVFYRGDLCLGGAIIEH